jgi:hypothetical protein
MGAFGKNMFFIHAFPIPPCSGGAGRVTPCAPALAGGARLLTSRRFTQRKFRHGQPLSVNGDSFWKMKTPTARYFMRKEECAPRKTPAESPFRNFDVRCLYCESYKLKLGVQFDESEGAEILIMQCTKCRKTEKLVL